MTSQKRINNMPLTPQIPIFLINLDRSTDRLLAFDEQMSGFGLKYERVPAVDGNSLSEGEVDRLSRASSGRLPWDKGAMGCFLSHRKVWELIIERELDWAFIAEDDLHIAKANPFFSESTWIPENADIIKAETFRRRAVLSKALDEKINGHDLRRLESIHVGAGGYFINCEAAEFLCAITEELSDPVDHVIFDPEFDVFHKLTIYQIDPAICAQDMHLRNKNEEKSFESTLQSERKNWDGWAKPKGFAKVWREISRPFKQVSSRLSHWLKNVGTGKSFKIVPYVDDP